MDLTDYRKIFEDNLETLVNLLRIKSIYDEESASDTAPFGKGVYEALLFMKDLALRDGFEVKEYDGNAISISYGKGSKRIDIASHLDVVEADDDAFNIRIEDGKLIGRGTSDMKVPMFLTYLSLKMIREKYPDVNKEIRIVLGTDEERTMDDMKYYVSKAGYPDFAFTPDGTFPMGIGEKGAIMWTLSGEYSGVIEELDGGTQCNIVSPIAKAIIKDNNLSEVERYLKDNSMDGSVTLTDNKLVVTINGVASHASRPHLGHSATIDLLRLISDLYNDELCHNLYDTYHNYHGSGFDSFVSDDVMDCLSVNLGVLKISDGKLSGQVDCRYPMSENADTLTERLKKKSMVNVSLDYNDDPTLCDENDVYVRTLLENYREITGDYSRPVISGGVSYSKVFKHCVSYGPNVEGLPSTAHQANEYVDIEDCYLWFRIYHEAIEKLVLLEV